MEIESIDKTCATLKLSISFKLTKANKFKVMTVTAGMTQGF